MQSQKTFASKWTSLVSCSRSAVKFSPYISFFLNVFVFWHANNWQEIFQKQMVFRNNWQDIFLETCETAVVQCRIDLILAFQKKKKELASLGTNRSGKVLKTLATSSKDQIKKIKIAYF